MKLSKTGLIKSLLVLLFASIVSACATVGKEFPEEAIPQLVVDSTTKADVKAIFGSPWRVGSESGLTTWTYGLYKYSVFSPENTKDLVIRFNKDGTVASYTFNTTAHRE